MDMKIKTRILPGLATILLIFIIDNIYAAPTVYPTGTAIYNPDRAWSGYNVMSILDTPLVIE